MGRLIAVAGLVLLVVPVRASAAGDDPAAPLWSAELEERIEAACAQEFGSEGVALEARSVPLARTGLTGPEGATCRALRFHAPGAEVHFTEILLCRWAPMGATIPPPGEIMLAAPLWTVTETALVFGPWLGPDGVPADPALLERVTAVVGGALDTTGLEAPCDEDPVAALPADVQLISSACHRHHLSLQVALPGSRVPADEELRALAPGKMVELWLIPDQGEVIHRWIAPPDAPGAVGPQVDLGPPFSGSGPFGDYTPKDSPDTVLDYRGELGPRLGELPPETIEALPELILLLQRQQRQALAMPGEWVAGNVILGADEQQYVPSDDELLEAAVGERVDRVIGAYDPREVKKALRKARVQVDGVSYRTFTFRHVDVMGSGRFFYASGPVERTVVIP